MTINVLQKKEVIIFNHFNITLINLGTDKIDDLNKSFKLLEKYLKKEEKNKDEIENQVINIITIIEMLLEDTKPTWRHNELDIPYLKALESAFFFFRYIKENNLADFISKEIYNDFKTFLRKSISYLVYNESETVWKAKVWYWLQKEGYVSSSYYGVISSNFSQKENDFFSDNELDEFYQKNHREIIDWLIKYFKNCGVEFPCPLDNRAKTYLRLLRKYEDLTNLSTRPAIERAGELERYV